MAQTQSAETGGWGSGFRDFLSGAGDLVLDVGRSKFIDVETSETNNVPDTTDIKTHNRGAGSDFFGGAFEKEIAGVPVSMWAVGILVVTASAVVLKKAKVI